MSSVSNRINDTMRVLTIISTIFIPLTFVAGIYGMNFDYFPEIHWRYGYPMAILLMIASTIGMIIFFYRQGWIFVDRSTEN
jgi:magnesium transporter